MRPPAPHDLLWIDDCRRLNWRQSPPPWVAAQWSPSLPLVVRRDGRLPTPIPVGIRGTLRSLRAAAWVNADAVIRVVSPEALVGKVAQSDLGSNEALPVIQALRQMAALEWPWPWGVTGSCGYMLATGQPVCRAESDLDMLIRCPQPPQPRDFARLMAFVPQLPCRVDIQLETPLGGCALTEWLRGGKVMVKTADGPIRVTDPWVNEEQDDCSAEDHY
ncbi:malonate decarboxylase holo-ACP synthase [Sodalis sp. dw_96]|uniref:malonate decarboxylase holo-ACP synthase n=1 Tax=Sodalis sp. dw_96 TaxID=2719794 RepID=UPI001BD2C848|nr:malonate decarboxylase holo-ACP synthase [Sodalis sp. dw_96]